MVTVRDPAYVSTRVAEAPEVPARYIRCMRAKPKGGEAIHFRARNARNAAGLVGWLIYLYIAADFQPP